MVPCVYVRVCARVRAHGASTGQQPREIFEVKVDETFSIRGENNLPWLSFARDVSRSRMIGRVVFVYWKGEHFGGGDLFRHVVGVRETYSTELASIQVPCSGFSCYKATPQEEDAERLP